MAAFWLDREPVTNGDYLAFVRAVPDWQRDRTKAVYVASDYLAAWADSEELGTVSARAPVVRVSWFAARAYCAWRGGRLPSEAEWELAAAADEHRVDARGDAAFEARILAWYERPTQATIADVGGGAANAWGVRDLHGLIWEWIDDFTASIVGDGTQVCGAEAIAAKDPRSYATFLRFAFRSSLTARDTIGSLGFRCAYDAGGAR